MGHVTEDELRRHLSETEASNGFGNRFMWIAVKRSKELPFPSEPDGHTLNRLITLLHNTLDHVRKTDRIEMAEPTKAMWNEIYHNLSADRPGLSGALLNRSEAYVLRLAALYALLDRTDKIDKVHLVAALALWEYAEGSVYLVFGNKTGDPIADQIKDAIMARGEMTDTDISRLFNRNVPAARLAAAKTLLRDAGRIVSSVRETSGRSETVWSLSTN